MKEAPNEKKCEAFDIPNNQQVRQEIQYLDSLTNFRECLPADNWIIGLLLILVVAGLIFLVAKLYQF